MSAPTIITAAQRTPEWVEARKGIPTCSRFDRILTPVDGKPSKSQESLINELLAESIAGPEEMPPPVSTEDMRHGMILEAQARCAYELGYAKAPVREVGFVLAACGMFGGSPDALVGEDGGLELKIPKPATHVGYIRAGVVPMAYRVSIHGYMIVTQRKWWDFFSHCRGFPPFYTRVIRDDFTDTLESELNVFCEKYNRARVSFNLPPLGKK